MIHLLRFGKSYIGAAPNKRQVSVSNSSFEAANSTNQIQTGAPKSAWSRLSSRSKKGIYLLLIVFLGFFTTVVGYIEYVNSLTGSVAFITTFAPFVLSLLLMGSTSIFLSVYILTRPGVMRSDILGSLWMLILLPISISLYSDFTFVDLIFIILIVGSAVMVWRDSGDTKWFIIVVGALATFWFGFDPLVHTLDYISLSAGGVGLGIVSETASLAMQRAIADWLRFGFFLSVLVATLKRKQ